MVILGILAIVWPVIATLAVDIYVGWLFLISGIVGLVAMFSAKDVPAFLWTLLTAALSLVVGVMLLWKPVTNARSILRDDIHDGLELRWRARDGTEDIADRGLIFQCFGQLSRACLKFLRPRLLGLEQPRVLDSDHRLVGVDLKEPKLIFGK
jgi:hypothetical protein